jgi:type IV pilus assembly protein PilB
MVNTMKKIGEILIDHGTLTQKQLIEALERQKKEPGRLIGELLIEMGYVTEEDIVVALATQYHIPYLPIANFTLDELIAKSIPKELIQKYLCVPLDRIGNLLTVVMADPTNENSIAEIETATGCKVQTFVATATEIANVVRQYYGLDVKAGATPNEKVSQISFRSAVDQKRANKTGT